MSVSDGQNVDAAVTNAAFLSRLTDSDTVGVVGLNNTSDPNSGDQIVNTQRLINEIADSDGTAGEGDANRKVYSSTVYVSDGTSRKVAIGVLDAALDTHVSDATNPHNVTASQVGNTVAQWNADQIQSNDVLTGTPSDGQVYEYNTSNSRFEAVDVNARELQSRTVAATAPTDGQALVWNGTGSQWEPQDQSGSGGGGILTEYITNGDAKTDTSGWTAYANTTADVKPDDFGGVASGNFTLARQTTDPARGPAHFEFSKAASDEQGEGFYFDFDLENGDLAAVLRASLEAKVISGTYADGDIRVYLVLSNDGFSADFQVVEPAPTELASASFWNKQIFEAQTDATRTDARLCIHVASTSAIAYTVGMDSISFGQASRVVGFAGGDWKEFTPTGTWTTNTTYSGVWRRVGDVLQARVKVELSGAPNATTLLIDVPFGLSIDTSKLDDTTNRVTLGKGLGINDNDTGARYYGSVAYQSTTTVGPKIYTDRSPNFENYDSINQINPITFASSDVISMDFEIPISGWSSNLEFSEDADTRVVVARASTNTSQAVSNGTVIDFEDVEFDTHGAITTGPSWKFTAPVSGYYQVYSQTSTSNVSASAVGQIYGMTGRKNGSNSAISDREIADQTGTSREYTTQLIETVKLDKGDTYDVVWSESLPATTLSGSALSNHIHIQRVSGPATIAASEKVIASYNSFSNAGSVSSGGGDKIIWTVKEEDSHNGLSSGTYTVSRSGKYRVCAQVSAVSTATSDAMETRIHINGTYERGGVMHAPATIGRALAAPAEWIGVLNSGDTIEIYGRDGTGGATYSSDTERAFLHIESI